MIVMGLAVAAPVLKPDLLFKRTPPRIAVMSIVDASNDSRGAAMAAEVTGRLTDGFAKIQNISVVAPRLTAVAGGENTAAPATSSDYEPRGELQLADRSWTLRARIIKTSSGEVQSVAAASVNAEAVDAQFAQARLAAGVGHVLRAGQRNSGTACSPSRAKRRRAATRWPSSRRSPRSTRPRANVRRGTGHAAKGARRRPDNLDIAVAVASLQMRGIQMVWFSPEEAVTVEAKANATLEQALRSKPNSIAVLATCRFLSATNHFVESLVTCAKALSFHPWDGASLYLIGFGQIYLGRLRMRSRHSCRRIATTRRRPRAGPGGSAPAWRMS